MTAIPSAIRLDKSKTELHLDYEQEQYSLSAEYLRVYSPSAEVRGHGVGQEVLQVGKRAVRIVGVEAVGNYALKIVLSFFIKIFQNIFRRSLNQIIGSKD